jgi:hypothetical protein
MENDKNFQNYINSGEFKNSETFKKWLNIREEVKSSSYKELTAFYYKYASYKFNYKLPSKEFGGRSYNNLLELTIKIINENLLSELYYYFKNPIISVHDKYIEPKEGEKKGSKNPIDGLKTFTKHILFYKNIGSVREYFEAIQDAIQRIRDDNKNQFYQPTGLTVYVQSNIDNKVMQYPMSLYRNVKGDYLIDFEDFAEEYKKIGKPADVHGSDPIDFNEYYIIWDKFALIGNDLLSGYDKSDKMLFVTKNLESKKNECGYAALKYCYEDTPYTPEYFSNLNNVVNYIKSISKIGLKIAILTNTVSFSPSEANLTKWKKQPTIKKLINNKLCILRKLNYEYLYAYNYLHFPEMEIENDDDVITHLIIYDHLDNHFDVIEGKIKFRDDVYIDVAKNIIKNDKIISTLKTNNDNSYLSLPNCEPYYIVFDYETVVDYNEDNCMKEYSVSFLAGNITVLKKFALLETEYSKILADTENDELTKQLEIDEIKNQLQVMRKEHCHTFIGYDCSEKFIKWLFDNQNGKVYKFVGYNNANFDNFILLSALIKYRLNHEEYEFTISKEFYNGNQLLNFTINGRHDFFDLHKHLMGSLKYNCESFKIILCSKKSLDHNLFQQHYIDNTLLNFIENNEALKEYNEFDVVSTAILFIRYQNALNEIKCTKSYSTDLHSNKTIGGLIYKVFNAELEETNKRRQNLNPLLMKSNAVIKPAIKLPELNYEQYVDLQRSKIAGRVEMFNGVKEINERMASDDVTSLYPFVMAILNVYYPCGKIIEVNEYQANQIFNDEDRPWGSQAPLGFYYCDFDQSNLKEMNLPNIYAKKSGIENDWSYSGLIENYLLSSVMIDLLLKYKCKVKIRNGFIFSERVKSCELFGFLTDLMSGKNQQDEYKKTNDSLYNPALRETIKLLSNSLSGKVIEGLHCEKTLAINNNNDYINLCKKIVDKDITKLNFINNIGGKFYVSYETNPEKEFKFGNRPIYLGVLIYDYAKSYMYEMAYSKVGLANCIYTDTDAIKMTYENHLKWKKNIDDNNIQVPHWKEIEDIDPKYKNHKIFEENSKVYGSYDDEYAKILSPTNEYVFICLEKKTHLYHGDKSKVGTSFKFKGINPESYLISGNEPFARVIFDKKAENSKVIVMPNSYTDIFDYTINNKDKMLKYGDNALQFYRSLKNTNRGFLLCSSMRKIVKNAKRNVGIADEDKYNGLMNKIQLNYTVKNITIKNNSIIDIEV